MLEKKIHSEVVGVFPSALYQLLPHAFNIKIIALLCKPKIVPKVRFLLQRCIYPAQGAIFLGKKYHIRTTVKNHLLSPSYLLIFHKWFMKFKTRSFRNAIAAILIKYDFENNFMWKKGKKFILFPKESSDMIV
jgi:hypothetical protein